MEKGGVIELVRAFCIFGLSCIKRLTIMMRRRIKQLSFQMIPLRRMRGGKEGFSRWELPVFFPLLAREQTIRVVS